MKKSMIILFSIIFVAALVFAYFYFVQPLSVTTQAKRSVKVLDWLKKPGSAPRLGSIVCRAVWGCSFYFPDKWFYWISVG